MAEQRQHMTFVMLPAQEGDVDQAGITALMAYILECYKRRRAGLPMEGSR